MITLTSESQINVRMFPSMSRIAFSFAPNGFEEVALVYATWERQNFVVAPQFFFKGAPNSRDKADSEP